MGEEAPDRRIWIDGELVPWEEATVHVLSHSLQRGSLVFDYMSVHRLEDGREAIFRLPDHLERLRRSCELVGLPLEHDLAALHSAVLETVRANPGSKAVKVSAYYASIEVDVVPLDAHLTLAIAAYDPVQDIILRKAQRPPKPPSEIRLWIEKDKHNRREDIVPPQAKVAANYTSSMMAKTKARAAGYDEILLVDEDGFVAEGPTTNLFLVDDDGALRTPQQARVLLGVTRASILEIAKHDGIDVLETQIRPEELLAAREVFLTGTTAGVLPVASIDGQALGAGPSGPVSQGLREHFKRIVAGGDPAFAHWLTPVEEGG